MLLGDFRRLCPYCTHGHHSPLSPLLGSTHGPRRSEKPVLLYSHDPPPDGARSGDSVTQMTPLDRGLLMAVLITRT